MVLSWAVSKKVLNFDYEIIVSISFSLSSNRIILHSRFEEKTALFKAVERKNNK